MHTVHSPWRGLSHHLTSTCPSVTTPQQERAGALMLPSSCLDGSVTPVGPGQNPQYTGAVQRREAAGCSQGLKMSPQKTTKRERPSRRPVRFSCPPTEKTFWPHVSSTTSSPCACCPLPWAPSASTCNPNMRWHQRRKHAAENTRRDTAHYPQL